MEWFKNITHLKHTKNYILLFGIFILIFAFNVNSNTLMEPTSLSKDLYQGVILDDNYIN